MTAAKVLLIRHAEAVVSEATPPSAWPLSPAGATTAAGLGRRLAARLPETLNKVIASNERKAIETAASVTVGELVVDDRLREVSKPWYPDAADHQAAGIRYLYGAEVDGWEPQHAATARFGAALANVDDRFVVVDPSWC